MKFCAYCGAELLDDCSFCPKCGHSTLDKRVAKPVAPAQEQAPVQEAPVQQQAPVQAAPVVQTGSSGQATFAMVGGIVALSLELIALFIFGFLEIPAVVLSILATIFGAKNNKNTKGKAGFVMGIVGIALGAVGLLLWILAIVAL